MPTKTSSPFVLYASKKFADREVNGLANMNDLFETVVERILLLPRR